MTRAFLIAVALAVAAPASAQTGPGASPPPYSTGDQWPAAGRDRFYYAVQTPAGPGRTRYAYVDAVPDGHAGWKVTVACGDHATATGKEITRIVAKGTAGRGRMPGIGGEARWPDGTGVSFIIDQPVGSEALDVRFQFTDARCASGMGQVSTGD